MRDRAPDGSAQGLAAGLRPRDDEAALPAVGRLRRLLRQDHYGGITFGLDVFCELRVFVDRSLALDTEDQDIWPDA